LCSGMAGIPASDPQPAPTSAHSSGGDAKAASGDKEDTDADAGVPVAEAPTFYRCAAWSVRTCVVSLW
jgi:hypothetical protein